MLKCAVQVMRWRDTQGHTGQPSVWEIDAHTMYNQWATAPGWSLNNPRPKSITHLHTFSDNGVYVALQLFSVILVSDQWRRVLIPYSYQQAPWGLLHALGWLSRYTWDQRLYVVSKPRKTHSPILKGRFLHLTSFKLVAAGIKPPTSWLPGQCVTTRPQLSDRPRLHSLTRRNSRNCSLSELSICFCFDHTVSYIDPPIYHVMLTFKPWIVEKLIHGHRHTLV